MRLLEPKIISVIRDLHATRVHLLDMVGSRVLLATVGSDAWSQDVVFIGHPVGLPPKFMKRSLKRIYYGKT